MFKNYPHLAILWFAQNRADCTVVFGDQGRSPFRHDTDHPAIFVIGDDTSLSMGPNGFHLPSVIRAIRSCVAFSVISSAAYPQAYAAPAYAAIEFRKNAMIVETRLKYEADWYNLIKKHAPGKPILLATVGGGHA